MVFLFGFASIPLAYLTSLCLKKPSSGYSLLVIIYLITGLVLVMGLGIVDLMLNTFKLDFMSQSSFETILFFARFLPVFAMSFGIQKIYKVGSYQLACDQTLPAYLNARCEGKEFPMKRDNPLWGCCTKLCEETNDCYKDMNALRWDSHGLSEGFPLFILINPILLQVSLKS